MERRRGERRAPAAGEPLTGVRLRTGRELTVVDVSNTGMLVEGRARLLPGTHLDVHVTTADGRVLVRSRVVRARVSALRADLIQYRGALAFDRSIDTRARGYDVPSTAGAALNAPGTACPAAATVDSCGIRQRLTA